MDLNKLFSLINYIAAKHQSGKSFTVKEYNDLLPVVNIQKFRDLYPDFEKKQLFTDALTPFKVYLGQESYTDATGKVIPAKAPLMIDDNGYANVPSDYKHYSAIVYKKITNVDGSVPKISFRKVIPVTDQEFDGYQNSRVKQATSRYPICNFQNGYIRFLPKNLQYVDFVYLKIPATPYYAYTVDNTTDEYIYDEANSIQLEWREDEQLDIANILLQYVGINLSDTLLYQYAQAKTNEDKLNNQR
jgi:hypothetical protein